jgi:hypothetical protein
MTVTARATATRSGGWWAIDVLYDGQEYHSQAKRLDQVPEMAADVVSLVTGIDSSQVLVEVVADVPDVDVDEVQKASQAAAEAAERASRLSRDAVASLSAAGLTVRDIGKILHLSPQRVSQLSSPARAKKKVASTTQKVSAKTAAARTGGSKAASKVFVTQRDPAPAEVGYGAAAKHSRAGATGAKKS